ncbi:MAG TPA: N-acetylmuramoyl-L-alanine amidase [Candidatus Limnocylindria bacterium]|nr:N-acetylmuramoyl-L-alanine amidase [Candidatus Limnocylindria bacterium]
MRKLSAHHQGASRVLTIVRAILLALAFVAAANVLARPVDAAPPSWYPAMRWLPASAENYEVGRKRPISLIVIHETGGAYAGTLAWFRNPASKLSSHYVIRASDGEITQMVAEADTAFHARGSNQGSIGIEHEFDARRGILHTDAQYRSSAALVCAVARRYGIPADRAHIRGHAELPSADHLDPGPQWDWARYMGYVSACSGTASAATAAAGPIACAAAACWPAAGVGFGARGPHVQVLQWDLVYLGYLRPADVVLGDGRFGPVTTAAIRRFQSANGIPATGHYGPLTAAALEAALARAPTAASAAVLARGTSSSEVARLQTHLRRLGYMDQVTGYFGAVTEAAVRLFQRDRGIDGTGTYGPVTRAALGAALR